VDKLRQSLVSKIFLDDKIFNDLCQSWGKTLIVKLLGKSIGYTHMNTRLKGIWRLTRGFELRGVGLREFVCKNDLNQPLVLRKVWIWGHWYKVEYEGLHIICGNYGCYGHHGRSCTLGFLGGSSNKNPIMNMAASGENPDDPAIIPHPEKSASGNDREYYSGIQNQNKFTELTER